MAEGEPEAEADDEALAVMLFWLVMVAVRPVTLVQLEPTVLFTPLMKLTAAHCKVRELDFMTSQLAPLNTYLV